MASATANIKVIQWTTRQKGPENYELRPVASFLFIWKTKVNGFRLKYEYNVLCKNFETSSSCGMLSAV